MLTLRDLARDVDVTVLAGDAGLDVPVRWVHISELADPTPWLSGGELLLTTGMGLTDPAEQRAYVRRLADHGLAGLGFGVGFEHDEVPVAMLEEAGEHAFPLLEVPYDTPFLAITEKAFTRLVNEQYALLQRSIAVQERLQRIVLEERGLDAIAGALASTIAGSALLFDGRGLPLARHTFRRELDDEVVTALGAELHERGRRDQPRGFVPSHPDIAARALALPVAGPGRKGAPQAWLVAVKDAGGLAEVDRLVLHQAVTVVALEMLRRHVAQSTERRLAGDLLGEVISGALHGRELARRLEPFGLGGRVTAIVLAPGQRLSPDVCEQALDTALRDEAAAGLVATAGSLTCALLPAFEEEELFDLASRVRARVAKALDAAIPAGAGRAVAAEHARRAYHEARCALEARALGAGRAGATNGTNGNGHGRRGAADAVATYRDLGSFHLLLSLQDSQALRLFCDSLLAPIEEGEGHYGGELLKSLEAFIECNGQWETAAKQLFCHRHTLRYRIRRVEELTGRDLSNARDRIEFWLALRGRELIA